MEIEEVDRKVKAAIGFESMGFYEHKNYDRNYYMFKKSGEAIYEISYEFFPKGILEILNFSWIHYSIIFPKVNRILMAVLNNATYTDSHGSPVTADFYDTTLLDRVENVDAMQDFRQANRVEPFIENSSYYEHRLVRACAVQRQGIDQFVLPFFETYSSLQHVNDLFIKTTEFEKVGSRMNNHPALKRMIILKLCDNPEYGRFTAWFERRLLDAINKGMKEYESYLAAAIALKACLDQEQYKTLTIDGS
ncbi:hypothetical protein [Chryseolinea soli]|uniref:DUF4304 domain-containing protein n=1 Tax=Chryseolinea soli TaxID=2321403 RepID=A0A385SVN4_9BACT|nr:hypothetical protein [Chryseolinea soli]AYB34882.1 hypothetical protein D4L85_31780 [Chryseolinea soli]